MSVRPGGCSGVCAAGEGALDVVCINFTVLCLLRDAAVHVPVLTTCTEHVSCTTCGSCTGLLLSVPRHPSCPPYRKHASACCVSFLGTLQCRSVVSTFPPRSCCTCPGGERNCSSNKLIVTDVARMGRGMSAAGLQLHLYEALARPVVNFSAARLFINKTGSQDAKPLAGFSYSGSAMSADAATPSLRGVRLLTPSLHIAWLPKRRHQLLL